MNNTTKPLPKHWNEKPSYYSENWGIVEWGDALIRVGQGTYWSVLQEPSMEWIAEWDKKRLTGEAKDAIRPFLDRLGDEKVDEALHYCRYHLKAALAKEAK